MRRRTQSPLLEFVPGTDNLLAVRQSVTEAGQWEVLHCPTRMVIIRFGTQQEAVQFARKAFALIPRHTWQCRNISRVFPQTDQQLRELVTEFKGV